MAINVYIESTDKSALISAASGDDITMSWRLDTLSRPTAEFKVVDTTGVYSPSVGQKVYIWDGGYQIWGGTIETVSKAMYGPDTDPIAHTGPIVTTVTCSGWIQQLDKRVIKAAVYHNQTAGDIIDDILTAWVPGELTPGTAHDTDAGATITGYYVIDGQRVSDILEDLCQRSGYMAWVDADQNLYFKSTSGTAAPFSITDTSADCMWEEITVETDRSKGYRNYQLIRVADEAFNPDIDTCDGDGIVTTFTLTAPVRKVESIIKTTDTKATSTCSFSGVPSAGETVTIDGTTYTFRATVTNSIPNEVKIGVSKEQQALYLYYAVNDTGTDKGTAYSQATTQHFSCEAVDPGAGDDVVVNYRIGGTVGNDKTTTESATNVTWSAAALAGGVDGDRLDQTFGILNVDIGCDWYYEVGSTTITQDDAGTVLATGESLEVSYRRIGQDIMETYDSAEISTRAAIETGTGIYDHIIDDSSNADGLGAFAKAAAVLAARATIPTTITFRTNTYGLAVGQKITITLTRLGISGDYLIHDITASAAARGFAGFQYTVTCSNTIPDDWLTQWQKLMAGGATGPLAAPTAVSGAGSGSATTIIIDYPS